MKSQSFIIFLLVLIVLKLYPSIGETFGDLTWVLVLLAALALFGYGIVWIFRTIKKWFNKSSSRSADKKELQEINKTIKHMDWIKKHNKIK